MKSYNPLLWMVARIFWYKIVHVGDFILSLLRLYLVFFRTFIYGFLEKVGLPPLPRYVGTCKIMYEKILDTIHKSGLYDFIRVA